MGRDRETAKALRLLQKVQKDLQTVVEILEKVVSPDGPPPEKSRTAPWPEDPEFWREKWRALKAEFQERGTGAVEAFVRANTREFLLLFMRYNHIPLPGRSKPSKQQMADELVRRLREERILGGRVFTQPPPGRRG